MTTPAATPPPPPWPATTAPAQPAPTQAPSFGSEAAAKYKPRQLTEHRTQNEILRAFATRRDMRLWRANVGVATTGGRTVAFGVKGMADLSGIVLCAVQDGRFGTIDTYPSGLPVGLRLEIEVKSPTGRQRPEQRDWQTMIEAMGGIYILARSTNDVHAALETLIDGYRR